MQYIVSKEYDQSLTVFSILLLSTGSRVSLSSCTPPHVQVDLALLQLCLFNLLIVLILAIICQETWNEQLVVPTAKSFVFYSQAGESSAIVITSRIFNRSSRNV